MNYRIKLTLAALAAFILMSGANAFAAPSTDVTCIRQTTDSHHIPWPPPGNPADPTDPNNDDDDGSGSSSDSGSDCGHDHHGDDSGSDGSYPDNPYDPDNEPMPN